MNCDGLQLTLIHPIQDGFQHLVTVAVAVLLPDRSVLAPEHNKLSVSTTQSSKVGDLHNHWSAMHIEVDQNL